MDHEKNPHRREFLATTTGAMAAACVSGVGTGNAAESSPRSLCHLTPQQFTDLIGQKFHVDAPQKQQSATLVLKEVIAHRKDDQRPANLRPQGFSLMFTAVNEARLDNETYPVSGGGLPACPLLLNDASPANAEHRSYEVVMN